MSEVPASSQRDSRIKNFGLLCFRILGYTCATKCFCVLVVSTDKDFKDPDLLVHSQSSLSPLLGSAFLFFAMYLKKFRDL